MKKQQLSQHDITAALDYNPETGILIWKQDRNRVKAGTIAGTLHERGYLRINIQRQLIYAHRLIWLYVHGKLPEKDIDHIDGNRLNNALSNLRECSRRSNNMNRVVSSANTSGVTGVTYDKSRNKWVAFVCVDIRQTRSKRFHTKEEAIVTRLAWVKEVYGEFSFEHSQILAEINKSTTS